MRVKVLCYQYYTSPLSHIDFIFGMGVPWDDMHQPHSLLPWLLGFHSKQKVPQYFLCLKLTLYLVQSFMGQQVAMVI